VLCLIVVPLPQGKNPFTVKINNINNNYVNLQPRRPILERPLDVRPLDSFPAFHGTQRFNTEFTRALHLFLS
jgi:hypothetical protein